MKAQRNGLKDRKREKRKKELFNERKKNV